MPEGQEKNRQLAIWACELGLDDLRKRPIPTQPQKVKDYYALSSQERKQMNLKPENYKFWQDVEVRIYFDAVDKVRTLNLSNEYWLKMYRAWLNENDYKYIGLIDKQVGTYFLEPVRTEGWDD